MRLKMNRKIGLLLFGESDLPVIAYKDAGMFLYELSKNFDWQVIYLYFRRTHHTNVEWNPAFLEYVKPVCIGNADCYKEQVTLAKKYILQHGLEYDVFMFFNYGSVIWKLAKLCKKVNPNVVVYSKLDMGIGGFVHFCNNKFGSSVKNWFEKVKSRYVDFFTVETKAYFDELKQTSIFRNRIGYLPNGVSLLNIDMDNIESNKKENIIITIGRLGDYSKHTELLVDAIQLLPKKLLENWKFYFVGPSTTDFYNYVIRLKRMDEMFNKNIILTGEITNRDQLYSLCKKSKIICMPSRSEGACIAVIEAMYFGAYPVITNYSAFALDTTDYGQLGTIVQQNVKSLSQSLISVMENPKLNELNFECQNYARSKFDYYILAKRLNDFLENLIKCKIYH